MIKDKGILCIPVNIPIHEYQQTIQKSCKEEYPRKDENEKKMLFSYLNMTVGNEIRC